MCLLPVCLNWPGFPASACKAPDCQLCLFRSLSSKKYKSKGGFCCQRRPCHQRALGFGFEIFLEERRWTGKEVFFIKSILSGSPGLAATCLLGLEDCHPGGPSEQSHQEETGRSKVEVQQWQWRVVTLERLAMTRGRAELLQSLHLLPEVTRISSLHCIRVWGGHSVVGWCQTSRERPEVGTDALMLSRDYCDHRRLKRG